MKKPHASEPNNPGQYSRKDYEADVKPRYVPGEIDSVPAGALVATFLGVDDLKYVCGQLNAGVWQPEMFYWHRGGERCCVAGEHAGPCVIDTQAPTEGAKENTAAAPRFVVREGGAAWGKIGCEFAGDDAQARALAVCAVFNQHGEPAGGLSMVRIIDPGEGSWFIVDVTSVHVDGEPPQVNLIDDAATVGAGTWRVNERHMCGCDAGADNCGDEDHDTRVPDAIFITAPGGGFVLRLDLHSSDGTIENAICRLVNGSDTLHAELRAARAGYDDLHATVPGAGNIWSKVDDLLKASRVKDERIKALDEVAAALNLALEDHHAALPSDVVVAWRAWADVVYLPCPGCSQASGAERAVRHMSPLCEADPPVPAGHRRAPGDGGLRGGASAATGDDKRAADENKPADDGAGHR